MVGSELLRLEGRGGCVALISSGRGAWVVLLSPD